VTPATVVVGEPFSVTSAASAPFGLESVSWRGAGTGLAAIDAPHVRELGGEAVTSLTWSGLRIDAPGTFTITADARDARRANPLPHYPHRAGAVSAAIHVLEQPHALSR
jgi:hypothetical protein